MKQEIIRKIDRLFSKWDHKNTPGFALGIFHRGEVLYSRGYGMASLEHAAPITSRTIFDLGSTSKQFVAFCLALLERRKKISLEDSLRDYIPEVGSGAKSVRIRHLLHHTSGIRDYLALMELAGLRYENEYPDEQIIGLITRQRNLNFKPGDEFLYSNSGYLLLGEIIKRVSGLSLREFAEKNIFIPLGMRNTHFHDDYTEIVMRKAAGYAVSDKGFKVDISLLDVVGDGGVNTCIDDLAKWDANFYNNRVSGGCELIKRITTQGRLNNGRPLEYAHGLFVDTYRGQKTVSHGGAWVGYRSELMRFPEKGFTIACLSNLVQTNPTHLAKRIADICLKDFLTGPATPVKAFRAGRRVRSRSGSIPTAGVYVNALRDSFVEIILADGKYIFRDDESRYELYPLGGGRYTVSSGSKEIQVSSDMRGRSSIILRKLNAAPVKFHKIRSIRTNSRQIPEIVGRYYSKELSAEYVLSLKGSKTVLDRPGADKEELHEVVAGVFAGRYLSIRFKKDRRVAGFLLDYCRIRGIVFEKVLKKADGGLNHK